MNIRKNENKTSTFTLNRKSKKAISPVVATALLLVVAVVAVIAFQSWFTSYQSGLTVRAESQSDIFVTIERLEQRDGGDNATVYVRNRGNSEVSINEVRIIESGTLRCSNDDGTSISAGAIGDIQIEDENCGMTLGSVYEVVVNAGGRIFSETHIAR